MIDVDLDKIDTIETDGRHMKEKNAWSKTVL